MHIHVYIETYVHIWVMPKCVALWCRWKMFAWTSIPAIKFKSARSVCAAIFQYNSFRWQIFPEDLTRLEEGGFSIVLLVVFFFFFLPRSAWVAVNPDVYIWPVPGVTARFSLGFVLSTRGVCVEIPFTLIDWVVNECLEVFFPWR